MSDYIRKSDVIKIIEKAIENTSDFLQHDTQIDIMFEVQELPTLDEAEITRKAFERVIERLEGIEIGGDCRCECNHYDWSVGGCSGECADYVKIKAIKIVKEECGINE